MLVLLTTGKTIKYSLLEFVTVHITSLRLLNTFVTITLPIEMLNTSYQVQKTGIGESTGTTASYRSYCITNRTKTSFQTFAQQMSTNGFMWQLCGIAK